MECVYRNFIYAKINVISAGPIDGETYGWTSFSFFAMSGAWKWDEYKIPEAEISTEKKTYTIPFGSSGIEFKDITKVLAIGLNVYGSQLSGYLELDNIILHKADGTTEVLENFNKKLPEFDGVASGKLVASFTAIKQIQKNVAGKMFIALQPGKVQATFNSVKSGKATAMLMNSLGQVISKQNINAKTGVNTVELRANYRGPALLIIKQNSQKFTQSLILK